MTPSWHRVGLGIQRVATAGIQQHLHRSTAFLDRLVYHAVDSLDRGVKHVRNQNRYENDKAFAAESHSKAEEHKVNGTSANAIPSIKADPEPSLNVSIPNEDIGDGAVIKPLATNLNVGNAQNEEPSLATTAVHEPYDPVRQSRFNVDSSTKPRTPDVIKVGDVKDKEPLLAATAANEQYNPAPKSLLKEGHAVPSTRIQRAAGFANLGLGLALGTLRQRFLGGTSETNEERLANTLCRMRGAALKLGQMLSIQDEHTMLPKSLATALEKVRQGADAIPQYQLQAQLKDELGEHWETQFGTFDVHPFAAASIGQVHHATLPNGQHVVAKVQYPGVADSIHSDLRNLSMLVQYSGLAPKGLFLDNVIRVGEAELKIECDYQREATNQLRMKRLVEKDPYLRDNQVIVPNVIESLCTKNVFVSEFAPGSTIDAIATTASQDERNRIGRMILYICIKELFDWRFMQTDPNWGNFLYDVATQTTSLIDFGAAREYDKEFVDGYLRIVWASAIQDTETLMAQSRRMGFLTGKENDQMLRAHKLSGFTVGEPFAKDEAFDFRASRISERMSEHTSVFLRHRLTPPPAEVYTLHRKLAGAYMLCIKLGAVVKSRDILEEIVANHSFEDGMPNPL